jgi:hypothetical protein
MDCIQRQEMRVALDLVVQQHKSSQHLSEPHLELELVIQVIQFFIQISVEQLALVLQLQATLQSVCTHIFALHLAQELVIRAT